MPEEIEVPTEHLHETMMEKAEGHHGHGHEGGGEARGWVTGVALSSALIAVAAAIAALLAGHHANEAMLEQMQASDQWAFYQAKGIKSAVLDSKLQLLEALGKEVHAEDRAKLAGYEGEQHKIEEIGHEREASSRAHMEKHNVLARAVTLFQIAIALAAIAVLVRRRTLWLGSIGLGVAGAVFLVQGIL
jgi:hypothetical protein